MKFGNKGWTIACFLYLLILLGIMLLADTGKLMSFPLAHPPYDKLGHFILYGIASFLCHRAIGRRAVAIFRYPVPLGPLIFTLFTAGEEILQAILPYRSASLEDFIASFCGIVIFYGAGELWERKLH